MRVRFKRHGVPNTAYWLTMHLLNLVAFISVLRIVCVERPVEAFTQCPAGLRVMVLPDQMVREYARNPAHGMSPAFVDEALARGDRCHAVLDGDVLAAYGWYAFGPTPIWLGDLHFLALPEWVYMYRGFTDQRYRGRRLHAIGMTHALMHYRARGYRGLVAYVESINFDSLKSCIRMGYEVSGSIWMAKAFGHYAIAATPGCKQIGVRVGSLPGRNSLSHLFNKN